MALGTMASPPGRSDLRAGMAEEERAHGRDPRLIASRGAGGKQSVGDRARGLAPLHAAIMDPDPRYWDEAFARTASSGIVTPPSTARISAGRRRPAPMIPSPARFARANSDGIGGVESNAGGAAIPTDLKRIANAGNEIDPTSIRPRDRIFSQAKIADIRSASARTATPCSSSPSRPSTRTRPARCSAFSGPALRR